MSLRIAITGPTGEIGISTIEALESHPEVTRIIGMARRPFDPSERGWSKTEYRQGDILDRDAVDALVADVDVVVHLAFIIMGSREESARVNLAGTRNVFEATVAAARPRRLVYTSSVAAYGYHADNPTPITEDAAPQGSPEHYYSEQKAACESALREITAGSSLEVFVLRPSIVAGPKATLLADAMPWNQLPSPVRRLTQSLPLPKPLLPDPGTPLQLVHHDDVASAIAIGRHHDLCSGGRLQHRRRRGAVDVGYRRRARRKASQSSTGRGGGDVEGDCTATLRAVGFGVAACGPNLRGDGHQQG